jgi:hypothetical protein
MACRGQVIGDLDFCDVGSKSCEASPRAERGAMMRAGRCGGLLAEARVVVDCFGTGRGGPTRN